MRADIRARVWHFTGFVGGRRSRSIWWFHVPPPIRAGPQPGFGVDLRVWSPGLVVAPDTFTCCLHLLCRLRITHYRCSGLLSRLNWTPRLSLLLGWYFLLQGSTSQLMAFGPAFPDPLWTLSSRAGFSSPGAFGLATFLLIPPAMFYLQSVLSLLPICFCHTR